MPEATTDFGDSGPVCSVATIVRNFCRRSPAVGGSGGAVVVVVVVDVVVEDADDVVVDPGSPRPDSVADDDSPPSRVAQARAPPASTDATMRIPSLVRLRTQEWCHATTSSTGIGSRARKAGT